MLKRCLLALLQILYPKRCPFCDQVIFQSAFIELSDVCPICDHKIKLISEPVCKKCGKPVFHDQMELCSDCTRSTHFFVQGKALFIYNSIVRESIYRFKYSGRREYAEYYGKMLSQSFQKWVQHNNIEAIIPIPLHRSRRKQRGFNQAEDVAKVMGKRLDLPVRTNILIRVKKTSPQKELNYQDRKNNLKKAFKINRNELQLKCVLLVDDIYTTGSTMDEAAKQLINSGIECIYYICISIGRGYEEETKWM